MKTTALASLVVLCPLVTGCRAMQLYSELRKYDPVFTNDTLEDTTPDDVRSSRGSDGRPATLLSAFFGIDNGLPRTANRAIHDGAAGLDGMPVILSHEVDFSTLQVGDLRVIRDSGEPGDLRYVTLAPASDEGELRTVLCVGELGSAEDPPTRVEVIGNLLSIDGSANFRGASVGVIPLEDGPTIVRAEAVPEAGWRVGVEATPLPWGGGSGCPPGAKQVIRVTWAGGVTKPGGDEVGDEIRQSYRVVLQRDGGTIVEAIPFAVADLGDGDNNHLLCLDVEGIPSAVSFPAGLMTDPREDLNPDTSCEAVAGRTESPGDR